MATIQILLPRESHGQRSLAGYSPWGHKESDTTKGLTLVFLQLPPWAGEQNFEL